MQKRRMRKQVLVVIKKGNRSSQVNYFKERREAQKFIANLYREEIKKAPFYDYNNSYIIEEQTYAQISAGLYSVKFFLCEDQRKYK